MNDFLAITDCSGDALRAIMDRADELADRWVARDMPQSLAGRRIALWFFGQGFRNRLAFEIGARAMGADVSFVPGDLGVHEPIEDVGHYLGNWFDALVVRSRSHALLESLARDFPSAVINARTEYNHPCEVLSDLQFVRRQRGTLDGLKVVFAGEVTNLCMSWFEAAVRLPIQVIQVAPPGFGVDPERMAALNAGAAGRIGLSHDLEAAVDLETDVIYTDCWPKSDDGKAIREAFLPQQINIATVERMHPRGVFLPCPPVTRGQEVSAEALLSPRCLSYQAKDCLLHTQNALLEFAINS
jgi:ornithine carbamoyltransferase